MENEKTPTVEINMDKACTKCGQMGVAQNGFCLECSFENKFGASLEHIDLINNAIISASKQINAHLATQSIHIHRAYYSGSDDNKLSVGLTVELSPSEEVPDEINVKTKINFIETRIKEESSERVSRQERLKL